MQCFMKNEDKNLIDVEHVDTTGERWGGSKRWTFLRNDGHRRTIVTLPSVLSAVCIAQN